MHIFLNSTKLFNVRCTFVSLVTVSHQEMVNWHGNAAAVCVCVAVRQRLSQTKCTRGRIRNECGNYRHRNLFHVGSKVYGEELCLEGCRLQSQDVQSQEDFEEM